jgi:hypothetical protein
MTEEPHQVRAILTPHPAASRPPSHARGEGFELVGDSSGLVASAAFLAEERNRGSKSREPEAP